MEWGKIWAALALSLIFFLTSCDAQRRNFHSSQLERSGFYEDGNSISGGITINKSKEPYVEMLRLVQAFLKIKGEMAGRVWALLNDNAHIVAALRDTLVVKIASLHNLTLNFITILRKILEFAAPLLSNISAGFAFG